MLTSVSHENSDVPEREEEVSFEVTSLCSTWRRRSQSHALTTLPTRSLWKAFRSQHLLLNWSCIPVTLSIPSRSSLYNPNVPLQVHLVKCRVETLARRSQEENEEPMFREEDQEPRFGSSCCFSCFLLEGWETLWWQHTLGGAEGYLHQSPNR